MSELKDYNIMDIEAMDDERLEKSESGKIQVTRVYIKSAADKVIAKKDEEIASLKAENKKLKAKLESVQASAYADSVDAGMRERRLRRALYKACANWAHHRVFVRFNSNEKAWENMERKCLKKAEEYK